MPAIDCKGTPPVVSPSGAREANALRAGRSPEGPGRHPVHLRRRRRPGSQAPARPREHGILRQERRTHRAMASIKMVLDKQGLPGATW